VIISFEGGEGAGKTRHASFLCNYLNVKGIAPEILREPGGTVFSEKVRGLFLEEGISPMTELLLVLASRNENITTLIRPALSRCRLVIIDRFIDSTLVYQGVAGGLGVEKVREIMEMTGTWIEPDITFVLDAEPEITLQRIKPDDKFEKKDIGFHQMLREGFLTLSNQKRHRIIDTGRSPGDVEKDIIEVIEKDCLPCIGDI